MASLWLHLSRYAEDQAATSGETKIAICSAVRRAWDEDRLQDTGWESIALLAPCLADIYSEAASDRWTVTAGESARDESPDIEIISGPSTKRQRTAFSSDESAASSSSSSEGSGSSL